MNQKRLIKSFGNFEAKIENAKNNSNFFRFQLENIPEKLHEEIEYRWKKKRLIEAREKSKQWADSKSNVLPTDPKWLNRCPPIYRPKVRERIEEKKLFEQRQAII